MSPPTAEGARTPRVALLPSAGMGHLTPFLRLAAVLAARGCDVTLITPHPVVSAAEARHIAAFLASASPRVRSLEFRLLPFDAASATSTDPFFLQFEAIRRSAHLLGPLLASACPALSAVVTDVSLISAVAPVVAAVGLPNYVIFTSSAAMLALCVAFPSASASLGGAADTFEVPGLAALPINWLPQPLRDPGNLFTTQFVENGRELTRVDGIMINTWDALEGETLAALNAGAVAHLPPVIPVGPLPPVKPRSIPGIPWLDDQPERSVVYVSFGSRTALSAEQIRELGAGLEKSGCRFLWAAKSKKVDKEDDGVVLEELLGDDGFLRRMEGRGLVVKDWVDQDAVLAHPAVGGFLCHCGWNSVTEAAIHGVRVLAWPRHGDQRLNAWVVERGGLGTWPTEWSWEGDAELVSGEEIARRVRELVGSPDASDAAAPVGEEAVRAAEACGSSRKALDELIEKWGRQLGTRSDGMRRP
uniref:Glycosyltransferase n=1 Tax=Arisaema erubescens TaxID=228806 RepID=A0A859N8U3_9ARAE|nr:2-hydroxyflavanone C-glycosyltransferase [Arisaema erubescens]